MLVIAAFAVSIAVISCKKDGDDSDGATIDKITATVEGGAKYNGVITKVKMVAYGLSEEGVIATGNWNNGGFSIAFPKTVDTKYLQLVVEDGMGVDATYSINTAKWCRDIYFEGYDANDEYVCDFYYGKSSNNSYTEVNYIYVDSDVNITCNDTYGDEEWERTDDYSLTLKKGWNVAYLSESWSEVDGKEIYQEEYKTTAVNGLKWYSDEDVDW